MTAVFTVLVLGSIYWLLQNSTSELAPSEDEGVVLTLTTAAPNATLQQRELYADAAYKVFKSHPETDKVLQINSPGNGISVWVLKLWEQRKASATTLQRMIQDEMNTIAGTRSSRSSRRRCRARTACRSNS